MTDTGQEINPDTEMTIGELEELQRSTQDRFVWDFTQNIRYVRAAWWNYVKPRKKDKNGSYPILPTQTMIITIKVV